MAAETDPSGHDPVMLDEVLHWLDVPAGGVAVDCTLGRGGHALHLAERLGPGGVLVGLDADPRNLEYARARLAGAPCRTHLVHANFSELGSVLEEAGLEGADALLADLGVSTNQLTGGEYGLSFDQLDAPLDMRLNPDLEETAADLVNRMGESELADVLYYLAQERYSRRIARKIALVRRSKPIHTVGELATLVRSVVPRPKGPAGRIDPATRTFMALRMRVNRELDVLTELLGALPGCLRPGGRAGIISFHSGEDRLVKHALRGAHAEGRLEVLTKKPLEPTDDETARNPRARSAKLRVAGRPPQPRRRT